MHTAQLGAEGAFTVTRNAAPLPAAELLGWQAGDRLGVVVNSPLGGLGAGLLVALASSGFYDVAGLDRRNNFLYPEIYLIHVGGRWGSHAAFDFWPERKEIFVDDAMGALRAINAQAITHLAVPDGLPRCIEHSYREPEIAGERIRQCYVYDPQGVVTGDDVTITTHDAGVIWNFDGTVRPEIWVEEMERAVLSDATKRDASAESVDFRRVIAVMRTRWDEVDRSSPTYHRMIQWIQAALAQGELTQRYRSITCADALCLLG